MSQSRTPSLLLAMVSCLFLLSPCLAQNPAAGANVNMVSGTDWTTGDPFLQRQNEPSVAVSTRNPLHLLAGANDYRTVDLPGLLGIDERGDAWLGLFKSFDGGQTWQSTLVPGYPLDSSPQGLASPIHGLQAAADPTVRAGTNGLFYYSGIAFNRGSNGLGEVFLARFIDNDNRENGDPTRKSGGITNVSPADTIRYLGQTIIDSGTSGQFLDKPWLAIDIPRGSATCTINYTNPDGSAGSQTIPAGQVFMSYSAFTGANTTKIQFVGSSDCGKTFTKNIKLSESSSINQGTVVVIDPSSSNAPVPTIYVAWRRFAVSSQPGAILIAKSTDGGNTFTKGIDVVDFPVSCSTSPTGAGCPFDQGESADGGSFRSNTFPTLAVDNTGRVYVAWTQRQANGDAKIMMAVSADGVTWSGSGIGVDLGQVNDDNGNPFPNLSTRGHQVMPNLTFNAGKLTLVYYDLRQDHTTGIFSPLPDLTGFSEQKRLEAELDPSNPAFNPNAVFNPFITDGNLGAGLTLTIRRHTIDLQGAQASPAAAGSLVLPSFSSFRISHYQFGVNPFDSPTQAEQLQLNVPNLPLFVKGTQPFIGDYIDIAGAPPFVFANGKWNFNTAPTSAPVFHAVWTDNRDVRPPLDGDWTNYAPPFSSSNPTGTHPSVFDPTQTVPGCSSDNHAGMRNQNIYTARIAPGVVVSSPGNSKPLGTIPNQAALLTRMFAISVQNTTVQEKSFRITVTNQPQLANGSPDPNGSASLQQFSLVTTEDVTVGPLNGISRPVFVRSNNTVASITVNVQEITAPGGSLVSGGLQGTTVLNPDPTAPAILDPAIANPAIANPAIANAEVYNPAIANPAIANPAIANPAILNPAIANPAMANPAIANPAIVAALNPAIANPAIANPAIANPAIANPAIANQSVTDASYTVTNNGNTVGSYVVKLFGTQPAGTNLQLILSKLYPVPIQQNCQLTLQVQNVVLASIPDPVFEPATQLPDPELGNSSTKNATFALGPGETGVVTLRGNVSSLAAMQNIVNAVTPVIVSQASNTGTTVPPATLAITTSSGALPSGAVGTPYSTTLTSFGGIAPTSWSISSGSLPAGLALDPASGTISGTPTQSGSSNFVVTLTDSSPVPAAAPRALSITIVPAVTITTTTLPDGTVNVPYSQTLTATGATGTLTWSLKSGALPAGLTLSSAGVISGTPTTPTAPSGASFVIQVQDSGPPLQTVSQSFTIRIGAQLAITTATLPSTKFGVAYSTQLAASGGIGTITWSLASGSGPLPGGLSLSSAGVISGTPTAIGTFNFTVQVADSGTPQQTATKPFSITVNPALTLVFVVQPSNTSPNAQITPAIKVQVLDANGNGVSGVTVTLSVAVNPGNGVLTGTTVAVSANKGIALFASDSVSNVGIGYRLQATAPGAVPVLSNPFNIQ